MAMLNTVLRLALLLLLAPMTKLIGKAVCAMFPGEAFERAYHDYKDKYSFG